MSLSVVLQVECAEDLDSVGRKLSSSGERIANPSPDFPRRDAIDRFVFADVDFIAVGKAEAVGSLSPLQEQAFGYRPAGEVMWAIDKESDTSASSAILHALGLSERFRGRCHCLWNGDVLVFRRDECGLSLIAKSEFWNEDLLSQVREEYVLDVEAGAVTP